MVFITFSSATAMPFLQRIASDAAKRADNRPQVLPSLGRCVLKSSWDVWRMRQARLVKAALKDALARLKQARPLSLLNTFEQRMTCLGPLADAVAGIVGRGSIELRSCACAAMHCSLPELRDAVQVRG